MGIYALDLIRFLVPRKDRIWSLNSPFEQENFPMYIAERWVRANKAVIEDRVLIFHDEFRLMVIQQQEVDNLAKMADIHFDTMIDLERSDGKRSKGGLGVWTSRHSGKNRWGGPQNKVRQMSIRFKPSETATA